MSLFRRYVPLAARRAALCAPLRAPVMRNHFANTAYRSANSTMGLRFYANENEIPAIQEQVTGLEAKELAAHDAGKPVFVSNQGVLTGPFGTVDNPVEVPSAFSSRIVGCTGGAGDKAHELLWHEVPENETVVCMDCGQAFRLKKEEN